MSSFTNRSYLVLCSFCFFAILAIKAGGCTIPVFQYALQNWHCGHYQVDIITGKNLSAELSTQVKRLQDNKSGANYVVRKVEVQAGKTASMIIYFPNGNIAWESPLSRDVVDVFLDSPVRRELSNRLIRGDAGVWILVESGNKAKDDLAEKTLQQELERLGKEITLASNSVEDDPSLNDSMQVDSVDIKFSLIRVNRKNKDETFFISSLLKSEEDLVDFEEPMAFAVFGRGILLYALVGKGITTNTIEQACRYIAGPCSCVLKAENPGTDLLIATNWENVVIDEPLIKEIELPELTSITDTNFSTIDNNSNNNVNEHIALAEEINDINNNAYKEILLDDNIGEKIIKMQSKLISNIAMFAGAVVISISVLTVITKRKKK